MRIAILTLIGPENIGNRLQNYAVQELLKNKNFDVETLYYNVSDDNFKSKAISIIHSLFIKFGILDSDFYIDKIKKNPKMALVKEFNDKYINFQKKYILKCNKMKKYVDDYDFYCAGSDQIWNAVLVQNNDFLFMNFAPSSKTFSLSASMGTTYIPDKFKGTFTKGLMHVGNISVREDDAKDLIKEMVNRDVTVLLDPTLLINKNRWLEVSRKPNIELPPKYIVTYFLGELTESQKQQINSYAVENNCNIIEINGKHKNFVGPSEFISLISNAEFVFTDSFHGTAFSIIFNKKFIVFQRNNSYDMSSRIVTILKKFGLLEHFYNSNDNNIDDQFGEYAKNIEKIDYNIDNILSEEISKADIFLDKCLGLGDN